MDTFPHDFNPHLSRPGENMVYDDWNEANEIMEDRDFPNHLMLKMDDQVLEDLDAIAAHENLKRDAVIRELIEKEAGHE